MARLPHTQSSTKLLSQPLLPVPEQQAPPLQSGSSNWQPQSHLPSFFRLSGQLLEGLPVLSHQRAALWSPRPWHMYELQLEHAESS